MCPRAGVRIISSFRRLHFFTSGFILLYSLYLKLGRCKFVYYLCIFTMNLLLDLHSTEQIPRGLMFNAHRLQYNIARSRRWMVELWTQPGQSCVRPLKPTRLQRRSSRSHIRPVHGGAGTPGPARRRRLVGSK